MKRFMAMLLCLLMLCGCSAKREKNKSGYTFTDSLENSVTVESHDRVVSLYGSYAEAWTLAGGTLVGVTQDAVDERKMELTDVKICGTVKEPNLETVLSLEPDFVILSADIEPDTALDSALTQADIPHAYFRVDTYNDYAVLMSVFCTITGRDDLYKDNAGSVVDNIEEILAQPRTAHPSVLLLRAYSTGVKAKGDDILAGAILKDLGADNIVERDESLLDELSMEKIISDDPEYIFVVTMGDDEKAMQSLNNTLCTSPAWSELSAVKNGRFVTLPKELFHYKPNARWDESYEYIEKILYN